MGSIIKDGVTVQILLALVPYTKQNLALIFHPATFFSNLEKSSGYSKQSLRVAYKRAEGNNLISHDRGEVQLSLHARRLVQPFIAQKLGGNAQLMVIFDIPESSAHIRRNLRTLLVELKFQQIQRSVWLTDMDHVQLVRETVKELQAGDWVKLYEAAPVN
jgi:DNA-binding transcriptional regulator PaaX